MACGLLAEGRSSEVARMLEPLIETPLPSDGRPDAFDESQIVMRTILARIRLLRFGDAARARSLLAPFEASSLREHLDPALRADVALWLGWMYGWRDAPFYDSALALNLLEEAERLFREELNTIGRCWTLLGQAQAYSTIAEYQLMLRALDKASTLQETRQDAQAALWTHDLLAVGAHLQARSGPAQTHIDALKTLAQDQNDLLALGRAHTYQAILDYDLGRPPEQIIGTATEAVHILSRATVRSSYPLLLAYRVHIRALIRCGSWQEADRLIDRALDVLSDQSVAPAYFLLKRARLRLRQGPLEEAEALIEEVLARMPHPAYGMTAFRVALVRSELLERQNQPERAREWALRAHQIARETGHIGQQLIALLCLAKICTCLNALDDARRYLADSEKYSERFSMLPLAALRFRTLGHLAAVDGNVEEARSYFVQALSAYSLIGDVYRSAQIQLELARLGRTADPLQTRPLLREAVLTFNSLQARAELREAEHLLEAWPTEPETVTRTMESIIGASLARAALSVELVAETWLQMVERLLPDRWIGVFRCVERGPWSKVHEHGRAPQSLTFPPTEHEYIYQNGVNWLRLRGFPGPAFFLGVASPSGDDLAWEVAFTRLKPWLAVVRLAIEHALLRAQRLEESSPLAPFEDEGPGIPLNNFIYASPAMRQLVQQIHRIRASHSPVLVTGESGTGKELIARAVHTTSERKNAAFVAFNCSTVPHELFDSHLFGHERGAFTGATRAQPGVIRAADGGTLFLDEIGDLPLDVQPKLLRFLQEGEVFPLGARRPVRVNVRIVAATNQELETLIREGSFREDLYYRLNVIPLRVPPLRDRREEIPLLVRHFLNQLRAPGMPIASITNRALEALLRYDWPGNARQLRNELERAMVFVSSEPAPLLDLKDLSPAIVDGSDHEANVVPPPSWPDGTGGYDLEEILADTEKFVIERVLSENGGQVTASAEVLGLTRQGLYKKMKRLGIDPSRFQRASSSDRDSVLHLN